MDIWFFKLWQMILNMSRKWIRSSPIPLVICNSFLYDFLWSLSKILFFQNPISVLKFNSAVTSASMRGRRDSWMPLIPHILPNLKIVTVLPSERPFSKIVTDFSVPVWMILPATWKTKHVAIFVNHHRLVKLAKTPRIKYLKSFKIHMTISLKILVGSIWTWFWERVSTLTHTWILIPS